MYKNLLENSNASWHCGLSQKKQNQIKKKVKIIVKKLEEERKLKAPYTRARVFKDL